jgi:hypothetical protein
MDQDRTKQQKAVGKISQREFHTGLQYPFSFVHKIFCKKVCAEMVNFANP